MIRRTAAAAAWLLAATGVALGAAGLAAGIDHPASAGGRGELTSVADRAIAPGLADATVRLERLTADVDALGELGRTAIAALVRRDAAGLRAAIDGGEARIATIRGEAAALRAQLAALPGVGPGMTGRLGNETLARRAALLDALPGVDGLEAGWTRLAAAAVPATELTGHLLAHDTIAGQAVRLGSAGQYKAALGTLAKAAAELAAAKAIRDRLAASVDVATLDDWMSRNAAYDTAVRTLWEAMVASKGRVTPAVRNAAAKVESARKLLPPDARALVVILGDVARGGLNQAVIEIEQVRGPLHDAIAAALAPASGVASPSPSLPPSPAPAPTFAPKPSRPPSRAPSRAPSPTPSRAPASTPRAGATGIPGASPPAPSG